MRLTSAFLCLVCAALLPSAFSDLFVIVFVPFAENLTPTDVAAIEEVKVEMVVRRRDLRSQPGRRLDPEWCDAACYGFPFPECQVWNPQCYDHRRRLRRRRTAENSGYELVVVTGTECDTEKAEILLALEDAVSNSSLPIVDGSSMTCHDLVEICQLQGFHLWNADSDLKIQSNIQDGHLVCNGDSYNFSIETAADGCVDNVSFHLQGPNGFDLTRSEGSSPYMLFGNAGSDVKAWSGNSLIDGTYTLTVVPDGDTSKAETLSFDLITC